MKRASSLARKRAALPMSQLCPSTGSGVEDWRISRASEAAADSRRGVHMRPGMMQLARMLSAAWSRARARVRPTTADLLTVYWAEDLPGLGRRAVTEETLMIAPPPAFSHVGDGVAAHVDHAHEVDGCAAEPVLVGGFDDAAASTAASDVVMEDVDRAVALDGCGDCVLGNRRGWLHRRSRWSPRRLLRR